MRRWIAMALPLLVACSSGGLVQADGELVFFPASIDFGTIYIGYPAEEAVIFDNQGRGPVSTRLRVDGPFEIDRAEMALAGGGNQKLLVRFDPREVGTFEGFVQLGDGRYITLQGSAEEAPDCPPSGLCRSVTFDPETGACHEERAREGSPCGDACFGGSCREGECMGETLDCDDGNACTVDRCDPATGCVHYDDSLRCEEEVTSDDPCAAPVCDPEVGCTTAAAPDGTVCGEGDCTTSYICLQGACTEVTTPDGGACGATTPCQDEGTCVKGKCIQEEPWPLRPSWEVAVAPNLALFFDAAVDGLGRVFWAECSFDACDLVSVDAAGNPLLRKQLFVDPVGRQPTGSIAVAGDRVISTLAPNRIEARTSANGSVVWSTNLLEAVDATDVQGAWVDEAAPPVITDDLILVAVDGFRIEAHGDEGGVQPWGGWVVALERGDGAVRWVYEAKADIEGLIGDEGGSVYLSTRSHDAGPTAGGTMISIGTTGTERWRRQAPFQAPLATLGGKLVDAGGSLRSTADGTVEKELGVMVPTWPRRTPLMTRRDLYLVGVPLERCAEGWCPTWRTHFFRFDSERGMEGWRNLLTSDAISEPLLTEAGNFIYARKDPNRGGQLWYLLEFDPDRNLTFECRLPLNTRFDGPTALQHGLWITVDNESRKVMAFQVEDRVPPQSGWVTAGGTPERSGRPR